jgi:hypothetical protein
MTVLGFGMAITVAPLTTAVVNGVGERQMGVASGINNAVASIAGLLFIAVLGTVALDAFGRSLDRHLSATPAPPQIRAVVAGAREAFAPPSLPASMPPDEQHIVRAVVTDSYVETIQLVMQIAAALSWGGALTAALTVGPRSARGEPILTNIRKPS